MRTFNYTIILTLLIAAAGFAQVKYTWTGGSGSWQTASNWNPNGVPGVADTAVINSGTVTIDQSVTIASLFQNGATINGIGDLTITHSFLYLSGTHGGTGTTTISSTATGSIGGISTKSLSRMIVNEGSFVWSGTTVIFNIGAGITNNGTFDAQAESFVLGSGGNGSIINNGTFNRTTGTGSATISTTFINNGTKNVQSGTLLSTLSTSGSGTFVINPGSKYILSGGTHTLGGNTISGGGTLELISGTLNLTGSPVNISSGTTFLQDGGTIAGDGALLINGTFTWASGTHGGTGTTTISSAGTGSIGGIFTKTLSRMIVNEGSLVWSGTTVIFNSGAGLTNNGTFDAQAGSFVLGSGGNGSIINNGTFNRTTSVGSAQIATTFINNGTTNVQSGTLQSSLSTSGSGTFVINPGSKYILSGGTHTLGGNAISGGGTLELISGTMNLTGSPVNISSGTTLLQDGGTIAGDGALLNNGTFNWLSGTHGGTGTTTISATGSGSISGISTKTLSRMIVNAGSLVWIETTVIFGSGAGLTNNGTFDARAESFVFGSGGNGSIINNGTFNRTTGTGNAQIATKFINNDKLSIYTGTLTFTDSLLNNTVGIIKGTGTLAPPTSNRFISNGIVAPGVSPGILSINGIYPQTSNAVLNIEIGGYVVGTERDSLAVTQQAQLDGTLNIQFTNAFLPQIGDVFTIMSYGSRTGQFAQINLSNNVSAQAQYLANGLQIQITSGGSNLPPSAPELLLPADNDTVSIISPITFLWNSSTDPDNDPITYALRIFGSGVDTTIAGLNDTTAQFNGSGKLQPGSNYEWNVTASDGNLSTVSATWNFYAGFPTSIEDETIANLIPMEYSLSQNYPNPFNPSTSIQYAISSMQFVQLKVYDILGNEVATLVNEEKQPGIYEVNFSASDFSSGVYLYRIQAGSFVETKKMILLR